MHRSEPIPLSNEIFLNIYNDKKFRNSVAYAHKCFDSNGNLKYLKTCSYPKSYSLTQGQKNEALQELQADREKTLSEIKGQLIFVGMGMEYSPRYEDDVCNHRVRTYFQNPDGHNFFIEFGRGRGDELRIDHANDCDMEFLYSETLKKWYEIRNKAEYQSTDYYKASHMIEKYQEQPFYNYKGLENRNTPQLKYTLQNLLFVVNEYFECNFSQVDVDNHTLRCDDFICQSPNF